MKIDWLILADAAQVIDNKLQLLGGGWDLLTVNPPFPVVHRAAIAIAVRVPWHESDRKHHMRLQVVHDDGGVLLTLDGEFYVGRPANILPGQEQRMQFAANVDLRLEQAGSYAVAVTLDGEESERSPFRVVLPPNAQPAIGS